MQSGLNFTFPFQKINQEQRIVTGIATADNPDLVDDVVNFDASVEAFSNWVGNIREMHSPIAVGKLVDWKKVPVQYDGETYQGIEVSVYISKGAESTWQKILDGTLRGFSIGGYVKDSKKKLSEKLNRQINEITQYTLGELSVVDNPCNPAGMFAMIKSVNGQLEYVAESIQDVFYCEDDKYVSVGGESTCAICSDEMIIIGRSEDYDEILINKFIETINNSFEKALSDINTVPTDAMASEAKRGLDWRKEFNRGGTPVGVARARDIMNKDTLSISTVKRMHSFFARHEVDKQGKGFTPGDGYPSAGRIAWALWGGDPGKSWADAIVNRINNMNKSVGLGVDDVTGDVPGNMVSFTTKSTFKNGDFVSWGSSGGSARGKITRVVSDGTIQVPDSSFNITGTKDDPALLIQIWRKGTDGWAATDKYVGHKSSTVSRIANLSKREDVMNKSKDMCKMCGDNGYLQKDMTCPYCDGTGCLDDNCDCNSCDATGTLMEGDNCPMCKMVDTATMSAGGGIKNPQQGLPPEKKKPVKKDAPMKTENGEQYPAAAFAYVPDANTPSTWKLRLWESTSAKETVAQVSRAATALTSAGFRGNKVQIPSKDLAGVKEKIRAAWHRVNGADRPLPAVLKTAFDEGDLIKVMPSPDYAQAQVIAALQKAVGDVAVMYTHAHGYHWNVRGSDFAQYHALFEAIYTDVYESIDPLAENILKMGGTAPRGISDFLSMATIDDDPLMDVDPELLAADLAEDNDAVIKSLNDVFLIANAANQQGVCNFVAERIDQHQKWAWQLKVSDDIYEMPDTNAGMMVSKNESVGNLHMNKNYDNINDMTQEDLTDTQKQNILSKLGSFLFGKDSSVEKGQVVDVTSMNHNLRIVSEGNMDNAPRVTINVGGGMLEDSVGSTTPKADIINATPATTVSGDSSLTGQGPGEYALQEVTIKSVDSQTGEELSVKEGEEEMDFEKVLEGLGALLDEKLEKVKADITAEVDGKIDAIEKSVSEAKDAADELSGELEKVANSGAGKKSADIEADGVAEDEALAKSVESESFWGGMFVPTEVVKALGYNS
jgi:DNA-binding ferritin-like protein